MEKINSERLWKRLHEIGGIGADPRGGISRFSWTEESKQAQILLTKYMEDIGLQVRTDSVGNIFGKLEGSDPKLAPILIGSHLDTVPCGGYFDGNAGVAAALEVLTVISEHKVPVRRSIELCAFCNEEASQFLGGHFGSKAMAGRLPDDYLLTCKHKETGTTLYDAMKEYGMGLDPDHLEASKLEKDQYYCFIELHPEQGRTLLDQDCSMSILDGIAGIKQFYITFHGEKCHAGGMAMGNRHDALQGAVHTAVKVDELAKAGGVASRGTVGYIAVHPNEHNIVADEVTISVDFRELDEVIFNRLYEDLIGYIDEVCEQFKITYDVRFTIDTKPAICDKRLVALMKDIADKHGYSHYKMVSYPAHDAMQLVDLFPIAMIFLRSGNEGLAHHPDEYTSPEDMADGTQVLYDAVLRLANEDILK